MKHLTDSGISQTAFGVTVAGEFSNGINDCGLFVLGVGNSATYPGNCTTFIDWQNWNQTFKDGLRDFSLASMDATQNWWFWTWKVCEAPPWAQHRLTSGRNLVFLYRLETPLPQGRWKRPFGRISLDSKMAGCRLTHARASDNVRRWAANRYPSQARILLGRLGGQVQALLLPVKRCPFLGFQRPYQTS